MPADRQPPTGASSQPVVEMNIPLAHTVDGLIVDATTLPVGDKLVAHPYPASFGTDGFFHDLEIL